MKEMWASSINDNSIIPVVERIDVFRYLGSIITEKDVATRVNSAERHMKRLKTFHEHQLCSSTVK
jgi:hypothetical protein